MCVPPAGRSWLPWERTSTDRSKHNLHPLPFLLLILLLLHPDLSFFLTLSYPPSHPLMCSIFFFLAFVASSCLPHLLRILFLITFYPPVSLLTFINASLQSSCLSSSVPSSYVSLLFCRSSSSSSITAHHPACLILTWNSLLSGSGALYVRSLDHR